jgi:hypothetical protein
MARYSEQFALYHYAYSGKEEIYFSLIDFFGTYFRVHPSSLSHPVIHLH